MKFFAAISPFIGKTMEEAQAKFDLAYKHADILGGLGQFSGYVSPVLYLLSILTSLSYTGIDMSKYPLDEEFNLDLSNPKENMIQGFLGNFVDSLETNQQPWTPRRLGYKMALGGLHPSPVGTPEMIADVMQSVSRLFLHPSNLYHFDCLLTTHCSGSTKPMLMASTSHTFPIQAALRMSSTFSFLC